jgi:hypothetical protein
VQRWERMAERPDHNRPEPTNGKQIPQKRCIGDASAPEATDDLEQKEPTGSDAFVLLTQQVRELAEYLSYYVSARTDGVKFSLRNVLFRVSLAALVFVAISGLIVAASWCMLSGAAEGLAVLLGGRVWAGNILAGFLVITGLGLGMNWLAAKRKRTTRKRTTTKYENRQARQQADFGHNVSERAADAVTDEN